MWQLQRENDDLKAAIEAPPTFLAGIAQQAVENGTVERLLSGVMNLLEKTVTGIALKNGIGPQINLTGIHGAPVHANPSATGDMEETNYPEEAIANPGLIAQLI